MKIATITLPVNTAVQIDDLTPLDVGRTVTSVGRELYIYTESTKAGQYQFKATNTADVNTARLDSLVVTKDNAKANNIDVNRLLATVIDRNGNPVANQQVTITLDSNTASLGHDRDLGTDNNEEAYLSVKNSIAETVYVTARFETEELSQPVAFEATTKLAVTININDASSDGVAENRITATFTDIFGQPVAGQGVIIRLTEHGSILNSSTYSTIRSSGVSDDSGRVVIAIKNRESEMLTVTILPEQLTETLIPIDSIISFTTDIMSNVCGGKFNDPVTDSALGACIEVISEQDILITGTPSSNYLKKNGFKVWSGIYNEGATYSSLESTNIAPYVGPKGNFGKFDWHGFDGLGQSERFCSHLNHIRLAGRGNWTLANMEQPMGIGGSGIVPSLQLPLGVYGSSETFNKNGSTFQRTYDTKINKVGSVSIGGYGHANSFVSCVSMV